MSDTINPFMTRGLKRAKDKGYAGRVAEKKLAIRVGGATRPGSGSSDKAKGDILLATEKWDFLIENKSSMSKSFSVQSEQLLKIYQEALSINKIPALSFQFVDSLGKSEKRERWVCIPEHWFQVLIDPDR